MTLLTLEWFLSCVSSLMILQDMLVTKTSMTNRTRKHFIAALVDACSSGSAFTATAAPTSSSPAAATPATAHTLTADTYVIAFSGGCG